MSDKLKEFVRQSNAELLKSLPVEERLKGLSAEERLKGVTVDDLIAGLPLETLQEIVRVYTAKRSAAKPE